MKATAPRYDDGHEVEEPDVDPDELEEPDTTLHEYSGEPEREEQMAEEP